MATQTNPDVLVGILRDTVVALVRRDGPDLSARQLGVFLTVYLTDGPHTVRGLAAELNVSKPAITRALVVELALVSAFAVGWWSLGSDPTKGWFAPLLALNAAALGIQSSAIMRFGQGGLSTTYLTGTLTTLVVRIATGQQRGTLWQPTRILVALIAGAAAGATLVEHARPAAPLFQIVLLLAVVLGSRRLHRVAP